MRKDSGESSPAFADVCDDLARKLAPLRDRGETAERMMRECEDLGAVFRSWALIPPTQDERRRRIDRLVDLHREALELIATR